MTMNVFVESRPTVRLFIAGHKYANEDNKSQPMGSFYLLLLFKLFKIKTKKKNPLAQH